MPRKVRALPYPDRDAPASPGSDVLGDVAIRPATTLPASRVPPVGRLGLDTRPTSPGGFLLSGVTPLDMPRTRPVGLGSLDHLDALRLRFRPWSLRLRLGNG